MWETSIALRRAGASILITYFAREIALKLSTTIAEDDCRPERPLRLQDSDAER